MWKIAEALLKRSEFNVSGSIYGNEIGDSTANTYAGTLSVKKGRGFVKEFNNFHFVFIYPNAFWETILNTYK